MPRLLHHVRGALCLLLFTAACAVPASDLDALALESAPVQEQGAATKRLVFEAAAGAAEQRYGLGSRSISRLSFDAYSSSGFAEGLRGLVSARLDTTQPKDPRVDSPVLSLREAFLGWQDDSASTVLEFGRISLRNGPAYGFNPTDFLRDGALRTVVTVNPLAQRENRLGSVMLRAQRLWAGGGLSLAHSPKLESRRSGRGPDFDWGATNNRSRGVATLSARFGDRANSQVLLYKEDGRPAQLGLNFTGLLSDAVVAHAEWSRGREPDLLTRALGLPRAEVTGNRGVAGITFSTANRLSVTAEFQYNRFALDRADWRAMAGSPLDLWAAYHLTVQDRLDIASRRAVLLYATQKSFILGKLDLSGFVKLNRTDDSRMSWLELRYRLDGFDLALQWQQSSGRSEAEFGLNPIKQSVGVLAAVYF